MTNTSKKAAEILVECGYAKNTPACIKQTLLDSPETTYLDKEIHDGYYCVITVDPFIDTLEGRRQVDAIEDYLHQKKHALLIKCKNETLAQRPSEYNGRRKRLDRIKWCLEKLTEVES